MFSILFTQTSPSGSKIELKIRTVWRKLNHFLAWTLVTDSSLLEKDTENLKYDFKTRRNYSSFLFSDGFTEIAPSGSKIVLKNPTIWRV